MAEVVIYAEAKMGGILKELSGSTAGTTKVLPDNITKKESHFAQIIAEVNG